MSTTIACIGAGRVTRILLEGLARKNCLPERIIVTDTNPDVLKKLAETFPTIEQKNQVDESISSVDFLFISLHPPVVGEVLQKIAPFLGEKTAIVSLAPKIKTAIINQFTGTSRPVIRMIPNAASYVNEGYNPVAFGPACPETIRKKFTVLMAPLGQMPEVPEDTLEAYAVITAMGPTYLWFQLAELTRLAQTFGLSPADASRAVYSMTEGAVKTMKDSNLTPEAVMDLVPVKPLAGDEETIRGMYNQTLSGLYEKLTS
ncbi:pyrroline-5-carboxylate reductase family protein [Methanospirillum stamsii]|uniref:Pyrroline-5-carboxylate reductase n=1 Tax=Methanospirillum stamsii TaxID=1277351 RepID=A0A2V2MUR3_9EURY|nr:NAD(P)-binding domain-containing protein [Methanospirillum stamsii]PWR71119.1 pyrroline-5-carboxylate reductase [Methanospirillum stamsii]